MLLGVSFINTLSAITFSFAIVVFHTIDTKRSFASVTPVTEKVGMAIDFSRLFIAGGFIMNYNIDLRRENNILMDLPPEVLLK